MRASTRARQISFLILIYFVFFSNKSPVSSPSTPKRSVSPIRVNIVAPKSPKKKKAYKVPVKFYDSSDSSDSEDVVVNVKFSKNSVSVSYTPKTGKK